MYLSVELSIWLIRDSSSIDALTYVPCCSKSHEMSSMSFFDCSYITNPLMITRKACFEVVKFEHLWIMNSNYLIIRDGSLFIRDSSAIDVFTYVLCCLSHEMCHHCFSLDLSSYTTNPRMITTQSLF